MEEMIDVLNPNTSEKTGKIICKSIAHDKGIWHGAIHVWIISKDKKNILLQKRCSNKKLFPNMWDISVGGHLSAGEDELTSAKREVSEELGLNFLQDKFKYIGRIQEQFINNDLNSNEFVTIYKIEADIDIKDLTLQEEEVSETRWFNKKEFLLLQKENKIIPHLEEYKILNDLLI